MTLYMAFVTTLVQPEIGKKKTLMYKYTFGTKYVPFVHH